MHKDKLLFLLNLYSITFLIKSEKKFDYGLDIVSLKILRNLLTISRLALEFQ